MLITFLQNLLKILLFALIFSFEVSIAIPCVSLLFLLTITDRERAGGRIIFLIISSLIASGLLHLSWSLVAILFGTAWFAYQKLSTITNLHTQNAACITSLVLAGILAKLSNIHLTSLVGVYTLIFIVLTIFLTRLFLPRRIRHTVIEWIAPKKV